MIRVRALRPVYSYRKGAIFDLLPHVARDLERRGYVEIVKALDRPPRDKAMKRKQVNRKA